MSMLPARIVAIAESVLLRWHAGREDVRVVKERRKWRLRQQSFNRFFIEQTLTASAS